ncbi:MAG: recombinase family protein [Prevotella sp.]|nr:recombinase family protein [Candidatus Prevotella equi]
MKKFAIYIRVSTTKQGDSKLGLEGQLAACTNYINSQNGSVDKVFQDIESGKSRTRKGLWAAIDYCKETGNTLVINKLDRLARDVEFTFKVINTGIDIHFVDMPVVNTMILGVFASVAQYERELISSRTKAALKAKKDRGETWSENYGKNTGTTRAVACKAANTASCKAKKEAAKSNENNKRFWQFVKTLEKMYGRAYKAKDAQVFVDELNRNNIKTATGMEYDIPRFRAMYAKCKKLFA